MMIYFTMGCYLIYAVVVANNNKELFNWQNQDNDILEFTAKTFLCLKKNKNDPITCAPNPENTNNYDLEYRLWNFGILVN